MKVLVLLTDLFDAIGGIQTFNRCVVRALNKISAKSDFNTTLLVLNDSVGKTTTQHYFNPERVQYFAYNHFKLGCIAATFRQALSASVVIIGHINFVPLAIGLRLLCLHITMPVIFLFYLVHVKVLVLYS